MKNAVSVVTFTSLLFSGFSVGAYERDYIQNLSLEELLNIKIVSASRKEEAQHLAPGVITVVTAQDIKRQGARHLRDVLDRLVGIQVIGSHQDFHSKTSMRGINSSHHEDSVLMLLNGRPMRQATDGGLNSDLYIGFPVNSIERIEIIRGPGSVIYGTNAMAGVVNIITRDARSAANESAVEAGMGSFGTRQLEYSYLAGDGDYSINVELNHLSADGDSVEGITDEDGNVDTYETGVSSNNLYVNSRYKNLTINGMVMVNQQDSASSAFQLPSNPIDLERYFFDVGYVHDISSNWDISFNYTHGEDKAKWQINEAAGDNRSEGRSQVFETVVRGNINQDLNLLFGASHSANLSGFDRGLPKGSKNSSNSLFTQFDYMLTDKQKIIAGLQWNDPDSIESELSPRLGLIQGFGNHWWLKLLYSEAYRSPNLVETDIDAPQLKGVPTLDPENIATYDAQLIYQTDKQYFALALYHSKLKNLIVRVEVPGIPTTHENVGFVKFKGVEVEGRIDITNSLDVMANVSFQVGETDDGVKDSTFAPRWMAKAGVNYEADNGLTLSVFDSYFGESTDLNKTDAVPAINPNADPYHMFTINASIDMGEMWQIGKPGHSTLSLYLDNIFDEQVFAPDLNHSGDNNTIPHHWGRGTYLTYGYKF